MVIIEAHIIVSTGQSWCLSVWLVFCPNLAGHEQVLGAAGDYLPLSPKNGCSVGFHGFSRW